MAKGKGKIIPPYVIGDLTHTWGGLNTSKSDTRFLERGESFDSLNWITGTQKDNIQLRRGKQLIGQTNRNGNPVTGLGVGVLNNGNEVPFFTYDRKIMIYDKNIELIDYYFNSQSTDDQALSDDIKGAAQTFTVLKKIQIDFCKFSLKKVGSPVGNAVAKIYNISGTFGTDAIPSGIPLATSDPFDISTITTLYSLYSFKFTGLNKITLNEGQYAVSIEYPNTASVDFIIVGSSLETPGHSGNASALISGSWYDLGLFYDLYFYVFGVGSGGDTVEVNTTDILPIKAKGEDVNIVPYSNLAGSFMYLTSPNSSIYKINVANPKDVVDQVMDTFRFIFERSYQSRMFAVGRNGNTKDSKDPTGVYMSWTDRQLLSDYPAETTQGTLFTADGILKTFTGTLTVPAKNTIFYISITTGAGTEKFFDDGCGNLNSNLGGTGTINYATGDFVINFFTAPLAGEIGTATFNTEDATSKGVCDFSFNTATRVPFTGETLRQDDAGGNAKAVFPFNGVEYCFHILKTWQLTLATDDKSFDNLPYYEQIGIPNSRAAFPKGSGVLFLNNSNPGNPTLSILEIKAAGNNLTIVPTKLSEDYLDLTTFGFDHAVIFNWGDYDIVCCANLQNGKINNYNDVFFIRDTTSELWSKLDYGSTALSVFYGALISGDSLSPNIYTLFSGFDDDGEVIQNYWNNGYTNLDIPGMKKVGYFNIQGLIQPSQKIKVSYSLDSGAYIDVFEIDGASNYVNKSSPIGIGSFTIGENIIGGEGDGNATANEFEIDIPVHTDLFEYISFRLEATDVGYAQINKFAYKDIRFKRRRIIQFADPEINN